MDFQIIDALFKACIASSEIIGIAFSLMGRHSRVPPNEGVTVESFDGRLAVVTGGGTGMGRELVIQLAAEGCSVATCDLFEDVIAETAERAHVPALAGEDVPLGGRQAAHRRRLAERAEKQRAVHQEADPRAAAARRAGSGRPRGSSR